MATTTQTTKTRKTTRKAAATAAAATATATPSDDIVSQQSDALALLRRHLDKLTKDSRNATDSAASLACDVIAVVTAGNGAPVELVKASNNQPAISLSADILSDYFAGRVKGKAATALLNAIASQSATYASHVKDGRDHGAAATKIKNAKGDPFAEAEARASAKSASVATEAVRKQLGRALLFAGYALTIEPTKIDLSECKVSRGNFYVMRVNRDKSGKELHRKAIAVTHSVVQEARTEARKKAGTTINRAPQPAKGNGNGNGNGDNGVTVNEALKSVSTNQARAVNPANAAALMMSCTQTLQRIAETKRTLDADAAKALAELIAQAQVVLAGQPATPATDSDSNAA